MTLQIQQSRSPVLTGTAKPPKITLVRHTRFWPVTIKFYPQFLLGVAFATATSLPLVAPAIAQTAPALTVTVATSTPSLTPGGAATYTITVLNKAGSDTANNVTIKDVLPLGFTYDSSIGTPTLSGGATRTSGFTDPTSGDTQPTWNNFSLPATGKIVITFVANTNPGLVTRTYQNPVGVTYTDPANNPLYVGYDSNSGTAEDVTLTAPVLTPPIPGTPLAPPVGSAQVCGKPGADGVGAVSGVINTYFAPITANLSPGDKTIQLGQSVGSGSQINLGDLVLIIQMQDATIDSSDSNRYGSGSTSLLGSGQTSMGSSGLYEYAIATSIVSTSGGTLTLVGKGIGNGLINAYANSAATATSGQKRYQVIRVPQYASITLTNTLQALRWNGTVGGILVVDIVGQLNFNGRTIDTTNAGFRAGYSNVHYSGASTAAYRSPSDTYIGSGKGEGTAGTPRLVWDGTTAVDNGVDGYPGGDTGRGAPANAGGGGNLHNAGGGGGGNGGIGGQGGIPWEGYNGPIDAGGRPGFLSSLNSPVPWRLMAGGGGGGGDANNASTGVRGGVGAGIVMIRAGLLAGTGSIIANGNGGDRGAYSGAPDGAGGGGAGGMVLIQSRSSSPTANINIQVNGGRGGNTANDRNNEHGPGGGGGAGVVLTNVLSATLSISATGGASGKADDGAGIAHGAANGQDGLTETFTNTQDPFGGVNGAGCLPNLTVKKVTSTPQVNRLGIAKYKITVTNTATIGSAVDVNIDDPLPTGFTYSSTDSVLVTGGATRTVVVDPAANASQPVWGKFTIPPAGKVEINFQAKVGTTVTSGIYNNPAASTYLDPARTTETGLLTNTYSDYLTNTGEDVTVSSNAKVLMVKRITAINGVATNPNDNTTALDKFVRNTATNVPVNDQNCYWPTAIPDSTTPSLCNNTYTVGAINAGLVKPGDTIEYTVYFLNAGGADAQKVKICDLLRPNQTYVTGSLQLQPGSSATLNLTDANDPTIDRGQFVPANDPDPSKTANCNLSALGAPNNNGVVAVDLTGSTGNPTIDPLPGATSAGQPPLSSGWLRFQTKVNP
jgi:uncharacterized repeat protein (TIGR01451 family)